ncbi:hypothetical protein FNL56_09365 [Tardiphaga sp. vice304]|uniref:hypothetical protein n=1 Tax=unclassified Tardiphaga TaxID=2631404 RepID=UPI00116308AC|nr:MULTISPECIES: hypothetical protein [unclassified Tardiphaga]QDM16065.1 hypothetical protein FNL53_09210 [Tardiphaga sp. vice278]QDM26273.1 hypothetical protein FNL56_09365 [Tardiphaga sp. vice304]
MSKETAKPTRKYIPRDDARRFSDGVRLHPFVGYQLNDGWQDFRRNHPYCKTTPAEFAKSAIPVLQRLGLITLIDPAVEIPEWLNDRDAELARRGGKLPIWMPMPKFSWDLDPWKYAIPEMRGNDIIWLEARLPKKLSRLH